MDEDDHSLNIYDYKNHIKNIELYLPDQPKTSEIKKF